MGDFVFVTGGSTNEGQGFVMTGHSNFDGSGNFDFYTVASGTANAAATLVQRLHIRNTGEVSIGSSHTGFSGWRVLNIRGDSTGGMLNFENSSGTRSATFANQGSGIRYQTHISGGYHRFETNAASNALYIEDGGDVGIGTGTPDCALEVERSGEARIRAKSTNNNWAGLDLESHSTQSNYIFFRDNSAERARIQVTDGNDIVISNTSNVTERIRINTDGEVGIGTNNPTRKLHVVSTGSATYAGNSAGTNIALHLANLESGAAGRTIGIGMSSESNAEVYLNCVTAANNNGGDFVIASRSGGRSEKMRLHAAGPVTKPLNPSFQALSLIHI